MRPLASYIAARQWTVAGAADLTNRSTIDRAEIVWFAGGVNARPGCLTVIVCVPVVTFPAASVAVYVIVVVPTGKALPVGTPLRTTVTEPEFEVAIDNLEV